ncbi:hypothetical protein [Flavobacterium sp. N1994]|uniref:hypothetical protein n=1 Tax=Flavobacterium sp. N1994 TaxID=2986827 RepID=UPI002221F247|nr:hypothetical protein [Flavobacterium sp. N1994]
MSTFSSKQYAWNDISVATGGRIFEGITDVEYSVKQEKKPQEGRGNDPHGILRGKKSYEGKITIWQSELEAMIESAPNKDILALNFDLVWAFVPEDGGTSVTDILVGCEITEYKKGMKHGDTNMLVELPFMFTKVKPQQ